LLINFVCSFVNTSGLLLAIERLMALGNYVTSHGHTHSNNGYNKMD